MKKQYFWIVLTFFLIALFSCGESSEKAADEKPAVEKKKKLSLKTIEGWMAKLDEIGITLPAEAEFNEVDKYAATGSYKISFFVLITSDDTEKIVKEWEASQVDYLLKDSWTIKEFAGYRFFKKKKDPPSSLEKNFTLTTQLGVDKTKVNIRFSYQEL